MTPMEIAEKFIAEKFMESTLNMKNTTFKKKTTKPLKRTKLKKVSKKPISKIQRELWKECRRVAEILYKKDCYTCKAKKLQGSNCQLGHVPYPKSTLGANLKYDMRVLRWQCFACNIHRGGQGAEAYKRMLKEEGNAYMEQLEKERQKTVKAYDHYLELLETYKTYEK